MIALDPQIGIYPISTRYKWAQEQFDENESDYISKPSLSLESVVFGETPFSTLERGRLFFPGGDKLDVLKIEFTNASPVSQDWLLFFNNPFFEKVELYQQKGESLKLIGISGSHIPMEERAVLSKHPEFLLRFSPFESKELVLSMEGVGRIPLFSYVSTRESARQVQATDLMTYTFLGGVTAAFLVFSIVMASNVRSMANLFFTFFLGSWLALFSILTGYAEHFFGQSNHWSTLGAVIGPWPVAFFGMIGCELLTSKGNRSPWANLLRICCGLAFASGFLMLTRKPFAHHTTDALCFVVSGLIVVVAGNAIYKRVPGALCYLASLLCFLLSSALWESLKQGWVEHSYEREFYVTLGFIGMMVFLSLGVGHQVRGLREKAIQKEKVATEMKKLIQMLCHDIANPLAVISMSAQRCKSILGRPAFQAHPGEDLSLMERNLNRVIRVGRDLAKMLEIAKSQQAQNLKLGSFDLKCVSLNSILQEVQELFSFKLSQKSIRFRVVSPVDPIYILGDRVTLLNEVFGNLLSNAIKFSKSGSRIEASLALDAQFAIVTFCDHGVGISEADLAALQEKGAIESRQGTAGEAGTGFGLPLVKNFVEKMRGTMQIESTPALAGQSGHGTTVRLRFPAENLNN